MPSVWLPGIYVLGKERKGPHDQATTSTSELKNKSLSNTINRATGIIATSNVVESGGCEEYKHMQGQLATQRIMYNVAYKGCSPISYLYVVLYKVFRLIMATEYRHLGRG